MDRVGGGVVSFLYAGTRNCSNSFSYILSKYLSYVSKNTDIISFRVHNSLRTYVLPLGFTLENAISRLLELQFLPNTPASVHHLVMSLHVASFFSAFVAHFEKDPFSVPPDAIVQCFLLFNKKKMLVRSYFHFHWHFYFSYLVFEFSQQN